VLLGPIGGDDGQSAKGQDEKEQGCFDRSLHWGCKPYQTSQ
jgi:hypothetical protein